MRVIIPPAFGQTPSLPAGPADQNRTYQFSIPQGPLDDVIDALEAVTGIEVELARTGLANVQSPGVQGRLSTEAAIRRMLQGTGIAVRSREASKVVLDVAGAVESVEVVDSLRLSSPKFTNPLVDTPQTISIINEKVFTEQGARNLTDVLRNTPGITFEAGENGFASGTSNFGLRGIDATGSVFVDGARDSGNFFRDVFNLEQVEVVKGPAADNGRGGAGGYVNLTTKTPQYETFQRLSLGYGWDPYSSRNRPRVSFDVNRRIGENTGVRMNALWDDGGVVGREIAERKSWGLAPSLSLRMGRPTRFTLSYQVLGQNDVPDWGVPAATIEGMRNYSPNTGGSANRGRFYGLRSDYDDVMSHALMGRFEHDFTDRIRFRNVTRWSNTDRQAVYAVPVGFTPATLSVTTQRQAYVRDNGSLSNLSNLEVPFRFGITEHTVTTGVEITAENSLAKRYPTNGILGNPGATSLANPDPNRALPGLGALTPSQLADIDLSTAAAYAYDSIRFGQKWLFTGGLRLERYGVNLNSRTAAGASQGPAGYKRTDTMLNGKAGLTYKPAQNGSIYASYGVSTQPPASFLSNPDISREGDNAFPGWMSGPNSATAKLQRARNYEVGTKWTTAQNRFIASAALFRTVRTNVAMAGTLNGVPNSFAGYAEQIIQGVELGVTGRITRRWSVVTGMLLMNSERRHDSLVDAARIGANPADYGTATTTNGDQLAFTPRTSGNIWTTYDFPIGLTLGGGIRHRGDSYLGRPDNAERIIPNGNAGKLPGYNVVDFMASQRINRRFTLRFNMDNVGNAYYPVSSNWAGNMVLLGPPRNFRVSTDINF
jgi:catecholate siderophore receptor